MHHDSRTYIELRYDTNSTDVVIVTFRDRGILPIEVLTMEFTLDSPDFTGNAKKELRDILGDLYLEVQKQD
jgi:hypothetical protein